MPRFTPPQEHAHEKAISTGQTASNIAEILEYLTYTPEKLESFSRRFSKEGLRKPFGPEERSFTEILAHLINSEARTSEAIYLALLVDEPLLVNVHSEREFGKLLRFDLLGFPDLLTYFKLRRTVLLRVLNSLTETQWSRCIREEKKQRKESVYWRARALAMHELEHLAEIESKSGK